MKHLTEEQLLALVDGGVAPNEEAKLHDHVSGCAECREALDDIRDLASALADKGIDAADEAAHVDRVMAEVAVRAARGTPSPTRRSTRSRTARFAVSVAATLALAAGVVMFVRTRHTALEDDGFVARGSSSAEAGSSLGREVGMRLYTGVDRLERLADGSVVAPDTTFTAAFTSLYPKPVHVLVFAVDGAGTVHWLYPAYTRATENPASVVVLPSAAERPMATSVVLEAPAEGAMRVLAVVTQAPLHVSDIEKRKPADLTRVTLERDFRAGVTEIVFTVRSLR